MDWYKDNAIKFNMIKFLKNREFCLLKPKHVIKENQMNAVRDIRCHSVQHVTGVLVHKLQCAYKKDNFNLYSSVARFQNGIPFNNLYFKERDMTEWRKNCWKEIIAYDLLIDIDSEDHSEINFTYRSAERIKEIFDYFGVPYELRFSGCGFHFVIPYRFLPQSLSFNPKDENNIYNFCRRFAIALNKQCSEMVDVGIYDHRRVCKLPYSIAMYENENYLCLPFLTDLEFQDFKLENFRVNYWRNNPKLMNRGTYLFNSTGDLDSVLTKLRM